MQRTHSKPGFSLVELLAAVVIIGIIAALAIPRILGSASSADTTACDVQRAQIDLQVQRFYRDTGSWPQSDLSDMVPPATTKYFPEGLPDCPLPGATYEFDPNTQRVILNTGS